MADRSPCKDEISFLSVKVSSVLPQSASAVFFVMRYKYKKGGASCQVNRPLSSRQMKKEKLRHEGLVPVSKGSQAL